MKKCIIFLLALISPALQAVPFDNQVINLNSTFGFRMQNRFTFETQDTENLSGKVSDFSVRRLRFRLDGSVWDPRLIFKFQIGLSSQDIGSDKNNLLDAAAGWKFNPKTTLWVGQMKLPGNRQFMTSSGVLNLVDRSIVSSRFNLDRDQGVQLHQEFFDQNPLRVKFAVTNGEGRNRQNTDAGMAYTGRVELLPLGQFKDNGDFSEGDLAFEMDHKLSLGVTYNGTKRVFGTKNQNLETTVFDYIYKYQGISWSGEFIKRWSSTALVSEGEGLSSQIGKMLEKNYEPVLRYSRISGEESLDQTTIGLNKYFNGHKIKLQNDLSYTQSPDRSYWTYRLQFEIGI